MSSIYPTLSSQIPAYIPQDSLIGWWPFNGNANDESGNNNNGTNNNANLTTDRFNLSNKAFNFDPNNNSHILIPFSNSLNRIQKGITISAWILMDGGTGSSTPPRILEIRGAYGGGGNAGFVLLSKNNANTSRTFELRWYSNNGDSNISISNTNSLSALSWHNITFTGDGNTGEANYYFDGQLIGSTKQNLIKSSNYNNNSLYIGAEPNLLGRWGGKIDDIGIWNRALNANEVKGLYYNNFNQWSGIGNFTSSSNWISGNVPTSSDSVHVTSGTLTINQNTSLDVLSLFNGTTVKLSAPLTVRNLYLKNGTIDLNGQKLTVTGRIFHSTDSSNYYIQAGTSASPKPRSELVISSSTAQNSTVYFNPNANRINRFEIGNGTAADHITLGNSLKIKGGEDGGSGPGLLTIKKNSKIIIPNGVTLTLESDTFNAGLSLSDPAKRAIICQGTGKFAIERDHYGARGWRLYSHPFNTDIDLQQVADDIELIGPGSTTEGFYSNSNTNASAYWYDYSNADSSALSDPAWTAFTSAKGTNIVGNANKWSKNSPLLLFNPGNRRGTDAFGSPNNAIYEPGKISLSYTLDSTSVHLNDGITHSITATSIPSYFPANGLVGYWPFNGNANDESGNGNNGTVNGASLTTDRDNIANGAYYFDGSNDVITVPDRSDLRLNTGDFTMSLWYKIASYGLPNRILLMKSNGPGNTNKWLIEKTAVINGGPFITFHTNSSSGGQYVKGNTVQDTIWHNVTFVRTGKYNYLYEDNILVKLDSVLQVPYSAADIRIGGDEINGGGHWHHGKIDDIAIWNRALTSSEISNLYIASTNTSISDKSKYFFITNPFTTPVKLCRIQGLNTTNVDPSFYYWKQRRNTVTNNFSPAEWQAERIFNGTALRDSNIAIPAFGTILVRLKNNNTTFIIPESAKQLSNFDYIIGGAKGTSKTGLMFLDASATDVGNNGLEIKLLVKDSQEADRVLIYNEPMQSAQYTTADARKYLNQDFPNVFTLSADAKPLALDMQDIKAELDNGRPEVAIPLAINREANKRFPTLKWEITANTTGLDVYLRNRENGSIELWPVGDIKTISLKSDASEIHKYELVFKRMSSSTEELTEKSNFSKDIPMELIVYPNPVKDKLHLEIINTTAEVPFNIYSITGVKVMEGSLKPKKTLKIEELNAGIYIIDAAGQKVKFVKE